MPPPPPGFPSGARHPLPLPRFASVPQGFPQVPGTRCRCLGSSRVAVRRVLEGVSAECFAKTQEDSNWDKALTIFDAIATTFSTHHVRFRIQIQLEP